MTGTKPPETTHTRGQATAGLRNRGTGDRGRAGEMIPEVEGTRPWGPSRKRVPKCIKGPKTIYTTIAVAEKQSKRSKKGPFSLYIRSPRSHPGDGITGARRGRSLPVHPGFSSHGPRSVRSGISGWPNCPANGIRGQGEIQSTEQSASVCPSDNTDNTAAPVEATPQSALISPESRSRPERGQLKSSNGSLM